MDRRRRTVPRSALRSGSTAVATPRLESSPPVATAVSPVSPVSPSSRYAPYFRATGSDVSALPPIRTGIETISPVTVEPALCFGHAPLSRVRWLPDGTSKATAVVGTADGAPGADELTFYNVSVLNTVEASLLDTVPHPGKVSDLSAFEGGVLAASTDGHVRLFRPQTPTSVIAELPTLSAGRREPVAAVAALPGGVVLTFGAHGTLHSPEGGIQPRADPVGFRAAAALDRATAAAAGLSGDVGIWDARAGRVQTLGGGNGACCVSADPAQPHFVLAGTLGGELAVWDRRMADAPVGRVALHDGPVWELAVVASRPGLLLSCGEDSKVWLMDFSAASGRAAMGTAADKWRDKGEHWRAQLTQSDLRDVGALSTLAVNSVATHPMADLYAFVSDSASVTFGSLYN